MVDIGGFDANKVEPQSVREIIPAGDYLAIIADSEKVETKARDGYMIKMKLQIIEEGQYKNRTLFDNLNLWNKSEQAVQIAQSTLSAICHAVGVLQPKDTSQLHNKPLCIVVKTGKYNDNPTNSIAGYKNAAERGKKPVPPPQDATSTATVSKDKAPWD